MDKIKTMRKWVNQNKITLYQWLDVILLSLTASATVLLLVYIEKPLTWLSLTLSFSLPIYLSLSLCCVGGALLSKLLIDTGITSRDACIKNIKISYLKYPKTEVACVFTCMFLLIYACFLLSLNLSSIFNAKLLSQYFCFGLGLVIGRNYFQFVSGNQSNENKGQFETQKTSEELSLADWIYSESSINAKADLKFDHALYVDRICKRLTTIPQSNICLYGSYGAGKSSVINTVVRELEEDRKSSWLIARVDLWGVDANKVAEITLQSIVESLNQKLDTLTFNGIAKQYFDALKGSGGLFNKISPFLASGIKDFNKQLNEISNILKAQNIKVLVVVEDADRVAQAAVLCNELSALIDRFRPFRDIKFLIAVGYSEEASTPLLKVTDFQEILAKKDFVKILCEYYFQCLDKAKKHNCIILNTASTQYFDLQHAEILIKISNVLATPRQLKMMFRAVDEVWQPKMLMGEVDLLDLIVSSTLKVSNPTVIEYFSHNDSNIGNFNEQTRQANETAEYHLQVGTIANKIRLQINEDEIELLSLLDPKLSDTSQLNEAVYQRVNSNSGSYLTRILQGGLSENEVSDQALLNQFINYCSLPAEQRYKLLTDREVIESYVVFSSHIWGEIPDTERWLQTLLEDWYSCYHSVGNHQDKERVNRDLVMKNISLLCTCYEIGDRNLQPVYLDWIKQVINQSPHVIFDALNTWLSDVQNTDYSHGDMEIDFDLKPEFDWISEQFKYYYATCQYEPFSFPFYYLKRFVLQYLTCLNGIATGIYQLDYSHGEFNELMSEQCDWIFQQHHKTPYAVAMLVSFFIPMYRGDEASPELVSKLDPRVKQKVITAIASVSYEDIKAYLYSEKDTLQNTLNQIADYELR